MKLWENSKLEIVVILFLITAFQLLQSSELPQINHFPPNYIEYQKPLKLKIEVINGIEEISEVYLFYKKSNQNYIQEKMFLENEMNPYFHIEIPAEFIDQSIEYYFRVILTIGTEFTSPQEDAINNPYRAELKMPEKMPQEKIFQKLSPAAEFNFTTKEFMVAISYFSIENEIQDKVIKLFIDERDVSKKTTITSNMLVYNPKSIREGSHTIEIVVYNKDNSIFASRNWVVEVKKGKITQKFPITINGEISARSKFISYSADDSSSYYKKEDDLRNTGQFKINGGVDWFRYKGRIYLSSDEEPGRQPVNRYSFETHIPHLSIYFGDHSPKFTNTTISGKNVRGIEGKFEFGILNLHSFYGQIVRNIEGTIDTTNSDTTLTGTYKRNCFGFRLQLGRGRKFAFGISAIKVKDDTLSEEFAELPKDNLVIGLDTKLALFRQKLVFGAEISTSLLNNNFSTGVIADSLLDQEGIDVDELPFSPAEIEKIFVINEYMEPFMPGLHSIAGEAYCRAFFLNNLLNVKYSYVGDEYNSLANPYLQKDKAGLNVKNTIRLLNNQINLTGGYINYEDNLNDSKTGTTESSGFLANVGVYPRDKTFPNINLNYQQSDRKKDVPDSLNPLDQLSNSVGFSTSYMLPKIKFAKTRLSGSIFNSNSVDKESQTYDINSRNYRINLSSTLNDIPLTSKISVSYMKTGNEADTSSTDYLNLYLRNEYKLANDKLKPFIEYTWTKSGGTSEYHKNHFTFGLSSKFMFFKTETFISGEISFLMYKNKTELYKDYNQTQVRLKISQKF